MSYIIVVITKYDIVAEGEGKDLLQGGLCLPHMVPIHDGELLNIIPCKH
jgi:hypothetical protein